MKGFARLMSVVVAAAALIVSCSKDKPSGSMSFDTPAIYLEPGQSITVGYSTSANIATSSVSISSKPDGWDQPVVNTTAMTVTVTAPEKFDDDVVRSGSFTLSGSPKGGSIASATLFVGVNGTVDLTGQPANSYLASQKDMNYMFDAMLKGDGRTELSTARLGVVWQRPASLVQYLEFKDGKASFYIAADKDDKTKIKAGNAVIGAYDASGTLIWSWHVWVTDYDLTAAGSTVDFNGYTLMGRNLGALDDANSTETEILNSYGLYYQWGRKDPFIYPTSFDSSESAWAPMYDGSGTRVKIKTVESSTETGTTTYATQNPLTFIKTTDKDADWMWPSAANVYDPLWADVKTVNDPCPYGWQVAPAAAFNGLQIKEDLGAGAAAYENKYGWTLTTGAAEDLFIAAGRRSYLNGSIQNYFDESLLPTRALEMQPWVGYYWTTGVQNTLSKVFCFWFVKANVAESGVRNDRDMGRANGMSVRCVKTK